MAPRAPEVMQSTAAIVQAGRSRFMRLTSPQECRLKKRQNAGRP